MTPKDWIKIVAGMLGIFLVGMIVVSGVNAGKRKVGEIATTASTLSIPMLGAPFRINDLKLGSLQQLQVKRSAPDRIEGFELTITLNDSIDVEQCYKALAFFFVNEGAQPDWVSWHAS